MSNQTTERRPLARNPQDRPGGEVIELEHGRFTDGIDWFSVRTATSDPTTIRVHALDMDRDDWALVITGLRTSSMSADWPGKWGSFSEEWKSDFLERVFQVYYACERGTRVLAIAGTR
ncbi:hypothetical protein [Glycomyces harbinensis]|uniref:Uncharacterized protein n=1 Tax=Glycomyces harbinensis TaxID=58114 RepID=A0A1G6YA88_9ACTN|nr:hypothetical protein [Glycomyces harbinensis]SDD87171.1 hypothetical protein SAMN05216270_108218 [Glycomyces harbinensis]